MATSSSRAQLVLLKGDPAGRLDLDQPAPLGSAAEVEQQIRAAVPLSSAVRFNERGEGRYTGPRHSLLFTVGRGDNVLDVGVQVAGKPENAFRTLRVLCDRTGWTLYDRASGRFPDLRAADPLRVARAPAPPFHWWTRLPTWVRILVGLLIGWLILYRILVDMMISSLP